MLIRLEGKEFTNILADDNVNNCENEMNFRDGCIPGIVRMVKRQEFVKMNRIITARFISTDKWRLSVFLSFFS